jgi:hypothetical protein
MSDGAGCVVSASNVEWSSWRKSTHSGGQGCLETRLDDGRIQVRDSKDPAGAVRSFTYAEWDAFVAGAKDGEFDLPV